MFATNYINKSTFTFNPLGHREDQITYMGTQLEENEQQLIIQVLNVNVDLFM